MVEITSTTDSPQEIQRAFSEAGQESEVVDALGNESEPSEETPSAAQPETPEPDTTEPAEQPGQTAAEPETTEEESQEEEGEDDETPKPDKPAKKKNNLQKRFDKIAEERRSERAETQQRIDKLERELREVTTRGQAETPKPEAPKTEPAAAAEEPKPISTDPKFKNYDEYLEALTDWKMAQKEKSLRAQITQEVDTRSNAKDAQEAAQQKAVEFQEAGRSSHADWDAVANSDAAKTLIIPQAFGNALGESEIAPSVMYHLVQHPEEAARVLKLTTVPANATPAQILAAERAAGREIARLETLVQTTYADPAPPAPASPKPPAQPKPAAKTATQAPKPITPLKGKAPATTPDPYNRQEMTFQEYEAWHSRTSGR